MSKTLAALGRGELLLAISLIREHLQLNANASLADRLSALEQTYNYMLRYFLESKSDPDRDRLYSNLREELYGIVRSIEYLDNLRDSPELYFATARNINYSGRSIESLLSKYTSLSQLLEASGDTDSTESRKLRQTLEQTLDDLFEAVWSLPLGNTRILTRLADAAVASDSDFALSAAIIGGLTLGAMRFYDRDKLLTLLDIDERGNQRVGARALTGIVLVIDRHSSRLRNDKTLKMRFDAWTDNLLNYRRLREVVMDIIRAVGSLEKAQEIRQEIIPDMMKQNPDLLNKIKEMGETFDPSDPESFEENPEWEEMLRKSGLMDKMRRLESMQREGADLMLVGIGQQKHMPFFSQIAHWFLPFSPSHTAITGDSGLLDSPAANLLLQTDMLCDSDKYSFALLLRQIPAAQREAMRMSLSAQQEQQAEEWKEQMLKSTTPEFDREALNYIRSLYRFFKFFRLKNEFASPFRFPFDFTALPFVGDMLKEREIVEMVAEHYFRQKYFAPAYTLFEILAEESGEAALYEKMGYCRLRMKDPQEALDLFERAELLGDSGRWLNINIARAADQSGDFRKAALYYAKIAEGEPENVPLLTALATARLKAGEYDEALKTAYQADYLSPGDGAITRIIAEARLLTGDWQKAYDKYEELIAKRLLAGVMPDSLLLADDACASIALGDMQHAAERLKTSLEADDKRFGDIVSLRQYLEGRWTLLSPLAPEAFAKESLPLLCDAITLY